MAVEDRVIILGGHGKVALLAAPKLKEAGYEVESVIRNPAQARDIEEAGATPVVLDIEQADQDQLTRLFAGARAIVFSAGAGGGSAERTWAVDHDAALRAMKAAEFAGVKRFILVSYASAEADVERVSAEDPFRPYLEAKTAADTALEQSLLDYTILGPGVLTLEPASGRIRHTDPARHVLEGRERAEDDGKVTSRENVAEVITHVIANKVGLRRRFDFYDGDTPIAEAIR